MQVRRAAVGIAALAAIAVPLVPALGGFLVVGDPLPRTADAIVVLAGGTRERTLEAAALYRQGIAPRVVVTRERLPAGDAALRESGVELPDSDAIARTALMGLGVPPRALVTLRRRNVSTASEARTIARWACSTGVRSLVVVTSPSHTRRARLVLGRALGPGIALTVRPSRAGRFGGARWYRSRADAKLVAGEWQKLVHFWLHERWVIAPCGGLRRRTTAG